MVHPWIKLLKITQCLLIFVISGSLSASFFQVTPSVTPEGSTIAPTTKYAFQLSMEITNRVFNDTLLNPNSKDYKKMYNEVNQLLADTFGCPSCATVGTYGGVAKMDFRSGSGSVIANTIIVFYTALINKVVVKFEFLDNLRRHPDSVLHINRNYTDFIDPPVPVPVPNIIFPTPPLTKTITTLPPTTPETTKRQAITSLPPTPPETTKRQATTTPLVQNTSNTSQHPNVSLSTKIERGKRNTSRRNTHSPSTPAPLIITSNSGDSHKTESPPLTLSDATKETRRVNSTITSRSTRAPSSYATKASTSDNPRSSTNARSAPGRNSRGLSGRVPGWAIALLVLAAVILLLLIIYFITLAVRWCCKKPKEVSEEPYVLENRSAPNMDSPINEPPYVHTVQPIDDPPTNKTGMYIVNS